MNNINKFFGFFDTSRKLWLTIFSVSFACLAISYLFFQKYLFMQPCEYCVYIRFWMSVICISSFLALLAPRILGFFSYLFCLISCGIGLSTALDLNNVYEAIKSGNIFAFRPCKIHPEFIFGIKFDKYFPEFFNGFGECGFDTPILPNGFEPSSLQAFFIDFYKDGFFVIPSLNFINMPLGSGLVFIMFFALLFGSLIFNFEKMRNE